jgi:hypothetical protein
MANYKYFICKQCNKPVDQPHCGFIVPSSLKKSVWPKSCPFGLDHVKWEEDTGDIIFESISSACFPSVRES